MATIVNNPPPAPQQDYPRDNGMGTIVGVVLLIVFLILFFFYGIPYITGLAGRSGPTVQVPSQVDVNLHNSK